MICFTVGDVTGRQQIFKRIFLLLSFYRGSSRCRLDTIYNISILMNDRFSNEDFWAGLGLGLGLTLTLDGCGAPVLLFLNVLLKLFLLGLRSQGDTNVFLTALLAPTAYFFLIQKTMSHAFVFSLKFSELLLCLQWDV